MSHCQYTDRLLQHGFALLDTTCSEMHDIDTISSANVVFDQAHESSEVGTLPHPGLCFAKSAADANWCPLHTLGNQMDFTSPTSGFVGLLCQHRGRALDWQQLLLHLACC